MTSNPARQTTASAGALAALSLAMLLSSLGTSVANVALPTLEERLGASFGQVQWVVLAYLLAVTTLVVSAGRLADLVGRRRLLVAGLALFTAASALCASAPGLGLLVAARAVQGTGAALMMALALALAAGAGSGGRTGAAMGLLGTTSAMGTALGPALGGALIAGAGWRAIFLVNVPLGLAALVLSVRHLPADERRSDATRDGFDVVGTVLLALALGAYALATTIDHGRVGVAGTGLLAGAGAAATLFVLAQRRAPAPLVRPAMLRDPALRRGLATSALVSTVMMATLVVGPFHLSRALGLDAALVGLVMLAGPGVVALAGVPAGRLTDRLGGRRLTVAGLIAMGAGSVLLAVTPSRLGIPGYAVPIVVLSLGYAIVQTANNAVVMAGADTDRRGVTSGLLTLSRNVGLMTGSSVMGAVLVLGAGTTRLSSATAEDVARGMHATFGVASLLVGAALAMAVVGARGPVLHPAPDDVA